MGRKPLKKEITKIELSGKIHVGVLRPRSLGVPDGGKEIFANDLARIVKETTMHDSAEDVYQGETDAIAKFAFGKMDVTATEQVVDKNNPGETLSPASDS